MESLGADFLPDATEHNFAWEDGTFGYSLSHGTISKV